MLKRDIDLFVINWYSLTSQKMIFFQGGKIFIVKIVFVLFPTFTYLPYIIIYSGIMTFKALFT